MIRFLLSRKRLGEDFCILALLLFASPAFASSPTEMLGHAETAFAEGVAHRNDSAKARPAFVRAAFMYDMLWNDYQFHTPELALNRSRAHRLAGNLPRSIAALHDGLAVARFARPLQVELEDARAAVQYPFDGDLAVHATEALRGVSTRMSQADAWFLAGFAWLVACRGPRFAMTRNAWWFALTDWASRRCLLWAGCGFWIRDCAGAARNRCRRWC